MERRTEYLRVYLVVVGKDFFKDYTVFEPFYEVKIQEDLSKYPNNKLSPREWLIEATLGSIRHQVITQAMQEGWGEIDIHVTYEWQFH